RRRSPRSSPTSWVPTPGSSAGRCSSATVGWTRNCGVTTGRNRGGRDGCPAGAQCDRADQAAQGELLPLHGHEGLGRLPGRVRARRDDGHDPGGARHRRRAGQREHPPVRGGRGRPRPHRAPRAHAGDRDHVAHHRARHLGDAGLPADARGLAARHEEHDRLGSLHRDLRAGRRRVADQDPRAHPPAARRRDVTYEARCRPPQPATPAQGEFTVHRSAVRDGLSLAYVREGVGGHPLLLLHGYPENKRIWWRNIAPLAAAGFEVIAPDLRGYGDSDLSPDDVYDLAVYSRDVHALVHDVLGHRRCVVAGGDIGGVVGVDLVHRFDDFVERLCFFNTVPPAALEQYAAAGMDYGSLSALSDGPTGDYRELQGARPDELAAMLPTPEARRQWVAGMYQSRLWASPGTFGRVDVDFMTEP